MYKKPRIVPRCFACNKKLVGTIDAKTNAFRDIASYAEYERTDSPLCVDCLQLENPFNKEDACRLCTLFKRPGPVFSRGAAHSGLIFIAEAPGEEEVHPRVMRPLMGGSGRVHDRICRMAGTDSNLHLNTNVVKCRPEHNRKPTDLEIRCCARYLVKEVGDEEPNVVVALGDTALYALTGRTGINKFRRVPLEGAGKRPDGTPRKVVATFHPAYAMRVQNKFAMPIMDIQLALEEAKFPDVRRYPVSYNSDARPNLNPDAVLQRCRIHGASVEDIETVGAMGTMDGALDFNKGQIVCIGQGVAEAGRADCYRWDDKVAALITAIHLDPRIEKVGQNCEQFDWDFLAAKGVPEPVGKSFDTLNAMHLLYPDFPKDLGTIGATVTDMEYWKHEAKKGDLFTYCCKDVDGTGRAYVDFKLKLRQLGLEALYYNNIMPAQPIFRRMRRRGVKKDITTATKYRLALTQMANRMEANLREGLGRPLFNVQSSKDVMDLLYNQLGLPVQYKRDKGRMRPTGDADAIKTLVEAFPENKILALVSQIRTIRTKYIATYIDSEHDDNYFVHASFGSAKAANGRLNSWGATNLQNWPEELRVIIVPDDEEHVFIEVDWGQIEWRLGMILSGDEAGIAAMASGYDPFFASASTLLTKPIETITKEERHEMKFFVYGLGYGRGVGSIAHGLHKTEEYAQAWMDNYARKFPDFWKWRSDVPKQVERDYCLINPFGRRRWWYTRMLTEAYNFPASSTAADMMIETIPKVENQLPKGSSLRMTVHDSLGVVAHKSVAKEAHRCMHENMTAVWPRIVEASRRPEVVRKYYPNGWYCPADIHIGNNWREAKKGNPALEKEILG